ncbi:MAG: transcriptional repressor NrdR [Eubacteriaceae bacterium]|nr:transcriptional repressor NrdR [Eubacteriaceae bacterium]MCR4893383.1 transcriptional regulator NrdR [Eubacteriales bacterium]
MKCPKCGCVESKVLDSRPSQDFLSIRRRRECTECHCRFTTYEIIENDPLTVVKKDNTRQMFDRSKIRQGIMASCQKRPVSADQIEAIVNEVENRIYSTSRSEISTREIGELVMEQLKKVDDVAYVRFASVYRDFKDVDTFMDELEKILTERGGVK